MEQSLADLVQRAVITTDGAFARSSRPDQLAECSSAPVSRTSPRSANLVPFPARPPRHGLRLAGEADDGPEEGDQAVRPVAERSRRAVAEGALGGARPCREARRPEAGDRRAEDRGVAARGRPGRQQRRRDARAVARQPLEPGIVVGGEVRDVAKLRAALDEFFTAQQPAAPDVRIGIGTNRVGVRSFEIEGIDDERQLGNAVIFRAHEAIAIPIDQAVLDYRVVGQSQDDDSRTTSPGRARRRLSGADRALRPRLPTANRRGRRGRPRGLRASARVGRAPDAARAGPRRASRSRPATSARRSPYPTAGSPVHSGARIGRSPARHDDRRELGPSLADETRALAGDGGLPPAGSRARPRPGRGAQQAPVARARARRLARVLRSQPGLCRSRRSSSPREKQAPGLAGTQRTRSHEDSNHRTSFHRLMRRPSVLPSSRSLPPSPVPIGLRMKSVVPAVQPLTDTFGQKTHVPLGPASRLGAPRQAPRRSRSHQQFVADHTSTSVSPLERPRQRRASLSFPVQAQLATVRRRSTRFRPLQAEVTAPLVVAPRRCTGSRIERGRHRSPISRTFLAVTHSWRPYRPHRLDHHLDCRLGTRTVPGTKHPFTIDSVAPSSVRIALRLDRLARLAWLLEPSRSGGQRGRTTGANIFTIGATFVEGQLRGGGTGRRAAQADRSEDALLGVGTFTVRSFCSDRSSSSSRGSRRHPIFDTRSKQHRRSWQTTASPGLDR